MNYKLKYSPDASDKLKALNNQLTELYGKTVSTKIIAKITRSIKGLLDNPHKGASVEALLGIPTPYRFLRIDHNYAFYRIDHNIIYITDIYNERENFMGKLFGINLRTRESVDFWKE